jgi:endonuclease YncB( thermonuclease family)
MDFSKHDINNTEVFSLNGLKTEARLVDVYDGDTITCIIKMFDGYFKFAIRLKGIDTNEMKTKNPELKQLALQARKTFLTTVCNTFNLALECSRADIQHFLKEHVVLVKLHCYEFDKYGRVLADVYAPNNALSLSETMIQAGLAYAYDGGTKIQH